MERYKIRKKSNAQHSVNNSKTIVDLFVLQAFATPEAIALVHNDVCITYRDLHEKTNRFAHYLRMHAVENGVMVPVFMEPGIDLVVAMLSIMKAGGTYVPIEPEYPAERVSYILKDTACEVVVSNGLSGNKLRQSEGRAVILIDEHWPLIERDFTSVPLLLPMPSHLAYTMYTSGSTGRPKGVMVEHAQIYTYIVDVCDRFELHECNSYAILGTFSADAGFTAVFAALCFGKRLNIIDVRSLSNFEKLGAHFEKFPVDCYKTTPSLMEFFLQQRDVLKIVPRKRLILGGEACSPALVRRVLKILPSTCALYNHYGPTETTVGVITYRFPEDRRQSNNVVPIGKPLAHVKIQVLNENLRPVENNDIGELCIEGPLLARGYLNNPGLTVEKFFTEGSGEVNRLYRTGDIVRTLPDGNIEYLGRSDNQVKIRGYRIELMEIESAVLLSGIVKQCVVMEREDEMGAKYLAGYVIPKAGFKRGNLLKFLQNKLPAHMIPARWMSLKKWPLTFNNKINKKALPDPELFGRSRIDQSDSPNEEIERRLKRIWQRLLVVEKIYRHDDFFELGGDSLKLIKLSFAIYDEFMIEISSFELFRYLTVAKLASYIQKDAESDRSVDNSRYDGFDRREASVTQKNLFIQNKLNPSEPFPNSTLTFEIIGVLDFHRLEGAFKEVIKANESMRTAFFFSQGKVYKTICNDFAFALEHHNSISDDIDREVMIVTRSFDFGVVPLVRVFIITLKHARQYLHIDMPHINSDGESMKLIIDELVSIYNNINVKPKLQFTDFQRNIHAYLNSPNYRRDEAFWQTQIAENIAPLNFRVADQEKASRFDGIFCVTGFPTDLVARLNNFIEGKSITRFQLFITAYILLLHKITSARIIPLMTPVLNRNEKGMEDVVGLITNVVLIKTEIPEGISVGDFIASCRALIIQALSHQKYPFERLLDQWKKNGNNIKHLLTRSSFFGYHHNQKAYAFDGALLKLYIPAKNKENLPLSAAVFETESDLTIRLSCIAGAFRESELEELTQSYFGILLRIIESKQNDLIDSVVAAPFTSMAH